MLLRLLSVLIFALGLLCFSKLNSLIPMTAPDALHGIAYATAFGLSVGLLQLSMIVSLGLGYRDRRYRRSR